MGALCVYVCVRECHGGGGGGGRERGREREREFELENFILQGL